MYTYIDILMYTYCVYICICTQCVYIYTYMCTFYGKESKYVPLVPKSKCMFMCEVLPCPLIFIVWKCCHFTVMWTLSK